MLATHGALLVTVTTTSWSRVLYEPLPKDSFGHYFLLLRLPFDVGCAEALSLSPTGWTFLFADAFTGCAPGVLLFLATATSAWPTSERVLRLR
jgi:hypothetical protein